VLRIGRGLDCPSSHSPSCRAENAGAPFRAALPALCAVNVAQNVRSRPVPFRARLVAIYAAEVTRNAGAPFRVTIAALVLCRRSCPLRSEPIAKSTPRAAH
jgi:hypothetical protein